MRDHYRFEQEIDAVVVGFETCTTDKEEFTHLSHLTVGVYYLRNSTPDQAFEKMRSGLLRFLAHHGVGLAKYNEQLTRAWINLIQETMEQLDPNLSLATITNTVLERLGESRISVEAEPKT